MPKITHSSDVVVGIAIFGTCFLFYLLVFSGHHYSIDGMVMFQYAKSLWLEHSTKMNPPVRWGGFDFVVPQWSIGLSLAYIPLLAILSKTIFSSNPSILRIPDPTATDYADRLLNDKAYQYCSVLNPLVTAFSAVALYMLCLELGFSKRRASATALTFGLISPATVYAKLDVAQPLASFFLLLGFLSLLKARQTGIGNLVAAGACLGSAILARSEFMLLTPILAVSVYLMPPAETCPGCGPLKTAKRLLAFGFSLGILVFFNQAIAFLKFGSWFNAGYPLNYYLIFDARHWAIALLGNLVSPGRGILLFCPISVLSVIGMKKCLATNLWFTTTLVTCLVSIFLFYLIWRAWDAGISWGPRYLIPMMPYVCLLSYCGVPSMLSVRHKVLIGVLLALQGAATLQGVLFDYLEFYISRGLSSAQLDRQLYHFSPVMSPLFSGWKAVIHPSKYDIKWLHLSSRTGTQFLFFFVALLCFTALTKMWWDFFQLPASSTPEQREDASLITRN
jgi:hypothetical protein